MSDQSLDPEQQLDPDETAAPDDVRDPEGYGGLSVEDDPEGTVDPAELAGTASEHDEDVS